MQLPSVDRPALAIGAGLLGLGLAFTLVARAESLVAPGAIFVLAVLTFATIVARTRTIGSPPRSDSPEATASTAAVNRWRGPLLSLSMVSMVLTAAWASDLVARETSATKVFWPWIASIVLLLLSAGGYDLAPSVATGRQDGDAGDRRWAWLLVVLAALLPRLAVLDRYPAILDSDESAFVLVAVDAEAGLVANPWEPGWFSNPNLYGVVQGYLTRLAGDDVAGHRLLSALLGAACVIATWRLGVRVLGSMPAMAGALVLGLLPLHLHMSRVALNNIVDPTALVVALWLLARTVDARRELDAALCGMALGMGLYGYFGGRAFPVIVLLAFSALVLERRIGPRLAMRLAGWIVAGFLVTTMPILVAFWQTPELYGQHMERVSRLSIETLVDAPAETISSYGRNLLEALLLPVRGTFGGYFRAHSPYLGWGAGGLVAIGVSIWIARAIRERSLRSGAWLLAPWGLVAAGVALTTPVLGHRLLAATPLMALAAGSGIHALSLWAAHVGRRAGLGSTVSRMATVSIVVAILSLNHLAWLTSPHRLHDTYGDPRTTTAWDLGWRLSQVPAVDQPRVLFAGAPAMFAVGFHNLTYLARDTTIQDVVDPIDDASDLQSFQAGTILVLVSERLAERCTIETLIPDAMVANALGPDEELLYTVFSVTESFGLSTARSPADTVLVPDASSPCG